MSQPARNLFGYAVAALGVLLVIALCLWTVRNKSVTLNPQLSSATSTNRIPGNKTPNPLPVVVGTFDSIVQQLHTTRDPAAARNQLADLQGYLRNLPPEAASGAIRSFLDSKADAPTHLTFKIGSDGLLLEAPSLRVALLDLLAQLDPKAAATYARKILESSTVSDEWAVALRNLARGDTSSDGRTLLETKTGELLRNEAWQRDPSVGYLEAFDTAVHLGGTNLLRPLTDLIRKKDNQAVARAAFLAMDRMTINQPTKMLEALSQHPDWMQGREETRANYFARADVREPAQRQVIEAYLVNPDLNQVELNRFVGLYPSANFMVSQNLLTKSATPDGAWLAARDTEALRVAHEWLTDPRFAHLKPQVELIRQRLESFEQQAKRSP